MRNYTGNRTYMAIAILDKRNRVIGWVDGWV